MHISFGWDKDKFYAGGFFMRLILNGEGSFRGVNFSEKNFSLEEFARTPMRNSFYLSYFLFADSILHVEMVNGNCPVSSMITVSQIMVIKKC